MSRPMLVGELNSRTNDPRYALWPSPKHCSGGRLCHKILNMAEDDYLRLFDRINLCVGEWSLSRARRVAQELVHGGAKCILLGARVCSAFGVPYAPYGASGDRLLVLPHPSGLCRVWNQQDAVGRARNAVVEFAPEIREYVGRCG